MAGTARVGLDLLREVGYDEFNRQSTHNMWMTSWLRKALAEKTCVLGLQRAGRSAPGSRPASDMTSRACH